MRCGIDVVPHAIQYPHSHKHHDDALCLPSPAATHGAHVGPVLLGMHTPSCIRWRCYTWLVLCFLMRTTYTSTWQDCRCLDRIQALANFVTGSRGPHECSCNTVCSMISVEGQQQIGVVSDLRPSQPSSSCTRAACGLLPQVVCGGGGDATPPLTCRLPGCATPTCTGRIPPQSSASGSACWRTRS